MALLLSVVTAASAASYKLNIGTMTPTAGGNIVMSYWIPNGGTDQESSTYVAEGATVYLTVMPADGYYVEGTNIDVVPSGSEAQAPRRAPIIAPIVSPVKGEISPEGYGLFTFVMPASNVTVNAAFQTRTDISNAWTDTTPTGTVALSISTVAYDAEEHKAILATGGVVYNSTMLYGTDSAADAGQTSRASTNGLREYDITPIYASADYTNAGTKYVDFTLRGRYKGTARGTYSITKHAVTVTAADQSIKYGGVFSTAIDQVSVTGGSLLTGHEITGVSIMNTAVEGTTPADGSSETKYPATGSYRNVLKIVDNSVVIKDAADKDVSANYDVTTVNGKLTIGSFDLTNAEILVTDNVQDFDGMGHTATVKVYQTKEGETYKNFVSAGEYDVIYYTGDYDSPTHTFTGNQTGTDPETGLPIYDLPKDIGTYHIKVKAKPGSTAVTGEKAAPADLKITNEIKIYVYAPPVARAYTESNPAEFERTFYGYPESDRANAVLTQGTLGTTATEASPVGSYPIRFSVLPTVGTNYTLVTEEKQPVTTNTMMGTLTVMPLALENTSSTISNNVFTYTGAKQEPTVTVTGYNNISIPKSGNWQLVYRNSADQDVDPINAGTYTVVAKALDGGSVAGEKEVGMLTINPKPVTTGDLQIAAGTPAPVYDGTAKEPTSLVVTDGTLPVAATDYTATYSNNINAGTEARVTLTMQGNYEGTVVGHFTIAPRPVVVKAKAQTIVEGEALQTGDGTATAVEGDANSGLISGHTLKSATVTTSETAVGTYTAAIVLSNAVIMAGETDVTANYAPTYENGDLKIVTKNPDITVGDIADQEYDGAPKTPVLVVSTTEQGNLSDSQYSESWENHTDAGTAKAIVTLVAPLEGVTVKTFTIKPRTLTITAKDQTTATGSAKVYGAAMSQTASDVTFDGSGLVTGHSLNSIKLTPATTNVGTNIELMPSLAAIKDANGKDVTNNYTISYVAGKADITVKDYSAHTADFSIDDIDAVVYDGQAQQPKPVVKDNGNTLFTQLVEGRDYTLSYSNNIAAGTATVTINFIGNYSGTVTKDFTISKRDILVEAGNQTIVRGESPVATASLIGLASGHRLDAVTLGWSQQGDPTVNTTFTSLEAGDYSLHVQSVTIKDANNNDVTANYNWEEVIGELTVLAAGSTTATMAAIADQTYTGTAITPAVTITKDSETLVAGTDYTLTYSNNVNVGTARVIAQLSSAKGGGVLTGDFNITKRTVTITAQPQTISYGGSLSQDVSKVTLEPTDGLATDHKIVSINLTTDKTAVSSTVYTEAVTAANAIITDGSGYDVTGNYTINYDAGDLTITAKPYSEATFTIEVNEGDYTYKAAAWEPGVTVKDGGTVLTSGTDYTVGYSNNVNAGPATVTVTFKDNYSGTGTTTFTIKKRRVTVTPHEQTITYNTALSQTTGDVTVNEGLLTGHTLDGVTLTPTKSDVGVYPDGITASGIRVKNGTEDVSGNYEVTSNYGKLTINKKTFASGDITVGSISALTYNGEEQTPAPTIQHHGATLKTLVKDTDYTIDYSNNTNAGTAEAAITFIGNYDGTTSTTFNIDQKSVTITATDQSIRYGESINSSIDMAEVDGLLSGHDISSLTLTASETGVGDHAGAISPSDAFITSGVTDVTANYTISYVSGNLHIGAVPATGLTVEAETARYAYDGQQHAPAVTVKDGATVLSEGTDYVVKYKRQGGSGYQTEKPSDTGTYTIVVTGTGTYGGDLETDKAFVIYYDRQMTDGQYTLCLPYAPPVHENLTYYVLDTDSYEAVAFKEVSVPEAFVPYLVLAENGGANVGTELLSIEASGTPQVVGNRYYKMYGTLSDIGNGDAAARGAYILQGDATWKKVTTEHPGAYIPSYRAYLTIDVDPYHRQLSDGMYTLCLPYDPPVHENLTYYTLDADNDASVSFIEVAEPKAYTPYLVKAVNGGADVGTENLIVNPTMNIRTVGNHYCELTGTMVDMTNAEAADAGAFILQSDGTWKRVTTSNPGAYISQFRAFLRMKDVPYTRDFSEEGLYTVCLPYTPPTSSMLKYYTLTGGTDSHLTFEEVSQPRAYTPYLVWSTAGAGVGIDSFTMDFNASLSSAEADGYQLLGSLHGMTNEEASAIGAYILQSDRKWKRVTTEYPNANIPPFRAYVLKTTAGSPMLLSMNIGGDTTGVGEELGAKSEESAAPWYTLDGRQIVGKPTRKGVYLHGGRKVVIR